jgi:hypothetical protein
VEQVRRLQAENEDLRLRLNQAHAMAKGDPALIDATLKALVDKLGREKMELMEELARLEGGAQELHTTNSRLRDEVRRRCLRRCCLRRCCRRPAALIACRGWLAGWLPSRASVAAAVGAGYARGAAGVVRPPP